MGWQAKLRIRKIFLLNPHDDIQSEAGRCGPFSRENCQNLNENL
jgi:hypothetical protein